MLLIEKRGLVLHAFAPMIAPAPSLSDVLRQYLRKHLGLSAGYQETLRLTVGQFERFTGSASLESLSEDSLADFMAASLLVGNSPSTVNNKRRVIQTLWRYAANKLHLCTPPGEVSKVQELMHEPVAFTLSQIETLLITCAALPGMLGMISRANFFLSLVIVCYVIGERISGLLSTRTNDYMPEERLLRIRAEHHKLRCDQTYELTDYAIKAINLIFDITREKIWPLPYCCRQFFRESKKIVELAKIPAGTNGKNLWQRLRRASGSYVEANGGKGHEHLRNSDRVFQKYYKDRIICRSSQVIYLPRPNLPF